MSEDKNANSNLASVHFINGNDQLRCEFVPSSPQSSKLAEDYDELENGQSEGNQLNASQFDSTIDSSEHSPRTTSSPIMPDKQMRSPAAIHKPHHNDEISSSFCQISSNGRIDTDDSYRATSTSPSTSNVINKNAESYEKYDFAIPLPFSEYKAPPKRSELSSFMHSPFSKTLDTFSKLSSLLKEDPEDRPDELFFRQPHHQPGHTMPVVQESQKFPPPALPEIEAKNPKKRMPPISEQEYDSELKFKSKLFLFERIFLGGLESDSMRRRLWPILLGVMEDENEANWLPLTDLFNLYMQQWTSITPDQESRFTSFKEKKSMAERDVIRCDRCHPYFQKQENIDILRDILMCYIMHDFDTGYVQGMTDLAAPLLYVFEGDPVKSFWCFVGLLNLTKKNFEMEQTTVKNLLIKLFKLVNLTDPCFAEFLADNESDNCYFSFRWLICLFKREFVKADNSYDQLLLIWDTLFAIPAYEKIRQEEAQEEYKRQLEILNEAGQSNVNNETTSDLTGSFSNKDLDTTLGTSPPYIINTIHGFENKGDFDDSSSNHLTAGNRASDSEPDEGNQLTNFELFFLSLSLAIIRQERDLIFTQKLDASGIIKHFNTLNLNNYLNETLRHATTIWYWLKYDGGEDQLYQENTGCKDGDFFSNKCSGGFDLLDD